MGPCSAETFLSRKGRNVGSKVRTLEAPLEHVARARAVTEGVRHLDELDSDDVQ